MKKTTLILLTICMVTLTACGVSNSAVPGSGTQSGPSAGELSAPMQVAIGTIKLDETDSAVTADQAAELLPLWQTLKVLYDSDTSATEEIDALTAQIQETMTDEQTQDITALNLSREDMFSIMQSQGTALGGASSGNTQSGSSSTSGGGFGPGGAGFPGGAPPDGGFQGAGPDFQGQGTRAQSTDSTDSNNSPTVVNPNRIPTPLIQAVIDYLKKKAGS